MAEDVLISKALIRYKKEKKLFIIERWSTENFKYILLKKKKDIMF